MGKGMKGFKNLGFKELQAGVSYRENIKLGFILKELGELWVFIVYLKVRGE